MKKVMLSFFCVIAIVFLCSRVVKAAPELFPDLEGEVGLEDSVSVNLTLFFESKDSPIYIPLTKNYGSKVQLSSSIEDAPSEFEFVYWNVNGFIRRDLPFNHQFVITEDMYISAVYKPVDAYVVCFMDANNQLISWDYSNTTDPFTSSDVPSLTTYSKPGYAVASNPWGVTVDFNNIAEDTFLSLQYVPVETPSTHIINVTNGTGTGTYDFDSIVTVVADAAPEGQYFSYWSDDSDNFVSTLPTYAFTAYEDKTLIAVYDTYPTEDMPYATLSNPLYLREDKVTFVGQFYLPEGYELIEYGIQIKDFYDIDLKYQISNLNPETGEFVATFDADWGLYANVYVTYINPADPESLSHLNEMGYTALVKNHPIISEYGEGSSSNKWIEIYNPSRFDTIDLSQYQIQLFSNGSLTVSSTLELTGSLAPGDVYVIANSSANASILALADVTSVVTNFNGDDAVAIFYEEGNEVIDVIGEIGVDPGTSWTVGSGTTVKHTLIRNIGVNVGTSSWNTFEWTVLPQDDISKLGYHENRMPSSLGYNHSPTLMVGQTAQLTARYNPIDSIRDGVWDSSNDAIATVSSDGLVTAHAEGTVYISIYSENYSVGTSVLWTITAPVMYDINASSANESYGTVVASPTSVVEGNSSTITITPASGYYTDYISVNGVVTELNGTNTYTINNITANQTVVVTFDALNTISVSSNNNDYGTVSSSVSSVMDGGNATLTFNPASGYRTDYLTINGTTTVQLDGAISYQLTNITSNQEIVVTFEVSETQVETLVKTIGFESSEGFSATTSYNNTTEIFTGNTGQQWGTYYGTPSTTGPISGSQSMQMRYYTTAPANYGYTYMNYDINGVTKVMFTAKNYANVADVKVSYSTDGGVTWIDVDTINLTTTATEYTVNINFTGNVRIKFTLTGTTVLERLTIDNVKIYGMR